MAKNSRKTTKQFVTRATVKQMIQSRLEMKAVVSTSNTTATTAGAISYVSVIAQGDGLADRSGDKIIFKKIDWTYSYADNVMSACRLILFQDTLNTGTPPTVSDVLSSATIQAHPNTYNQLQGRFRFLVDKILDVAPGSRQYVTAKGSITMNSPVYFTGTGATSASAGRNGLFMLVVGAQATGGVAVNFSQRFTDA